MLTIEKKLKQIKKNNTKRYCINCDRKYDIDVINVLDVVDNKSAYIRKLIRDDLKNKKIFQ